MTAIAAVAVGVWAASFWFHAAWMYPSGTLVGFARGEIHDVRFPAAAALKAVPASGDAFIARNAAPMWWSGHFAGAPLRATITPMSLQWWAVGIAAAWWGLIWWRLKVLREPHECWQCGYDRRGLSAGMACPECGASSLPPAKQTK